MLDYNFNNDYIVFHTFKLYNMKFYFSLIFMLFCLNACQEKSKSALELAELKCECFQLHVIETVDARAFADCNAPMEVIVKEHKSDTIWLKDHDEYYMDCRMKVLEFLK
jgi:hypothetical protein